MVGVGVVVGMKHSHEWLIKGDKIGAIEALTHKITQESSIFGAYGQIFSYNSSTCVARVCRFQRIKRPGHVTEGDEFVFKFSISELPKWAEIIGMPPSMWGQQECALIDKKNNRSFNELHT